MKEDMLSHRPFRIYDKEIIDDIKSKNIKDFTIKTTYKSTIENELLVKLKSDQNYMCRLAYANLGINHGKLDSTMNSNTINRAYKSYTSFYSLLSKGIKAKQPKYLQKDSLYILTYAFSKRLNTITK